MAAHNSALTDGFWPTGSAITREGIIPNAPEQFEEANRKLGDAVQSTSVGTSALMTLPGSAERGLRDLQQSLDGLVKGVVRTNLQASQEMLRVTTRSEFLTLQQRFLRDYLIALMQGSIQLIGAVRQAGGQAAHLLNSTSRGVSRPPKSAD